MQQLSVKAVRKILRDAYKILKELPNIHRVPLNTPEETVTVVSTILSSRTKNASFNLWNPCFPTLKSRMYVVPSRGWRRCCRTGFGREHRILLPCVASSNGLSAHKYILKCKCHLSLSRGVDDGGVFVQYLVQQRLFKIS